MIIINFINEKIKDSKNKKLQIIKDLLFTDFDKIMKIEVNDNCIEIVKKENLNKSKYKKKINIFANTLYSNIDKKLLSNFYNNLLTLKVNFSPNMSKIFNSVAADYSIENNKITIYDLLDESIYHELFHMSSSKKKDNIFCSGFYQANDELIIGYGLNEGYTEFLSNKYFDIPCSAYEFEVIIAKYLEKVIGSKKMEESYFSADLHILINELLKYSNKKSILNFLSRIDYYTFRGKKTKNKREKKFVSMQCLKIIKFLSKINKEKVMKDNSYSNEEKLKAIMQFNDELLNEIYPNNKIETSIYNRRV